MKKICSYFERTIAGIAMVTAVLATFMNVICRYCFNRPIYQAEEIATTAFVWLVFIGASACFKEGAHVGIDCLVNLLPGRVHGVVNVITDMMLIVFSGMMAYMAVTITVSAKLKLTSALRISYSFIDAAAAIACILMAVHSVGFLIRDIQAIRTADAGKEE